MTVQYVSVEDAIQRGGLRMVVVGGVPSPWGEAAKGILHIKGIDWVAVRLAYDSEPLKEWAGQRTGPVAVYEDEVDIPLNPKIGLDWMVTGQQKEVVTPGKNQKSYLAGAQDGRTGEVIWVEGDQKKSILFICLLWELLQRYPDAKTIHVILDNYSIHSTAQVAASLATPAGKRIQLHFLPPYCPDENRIERLWLQLHANVTRNHRCRTISRLLTKVRRFLRNATPFPGSQPSLARAVYA